MSADIDQNKAAAAAWFRSLRDQIVASFEDLETQFGTGPVGRFELSETKREGGGGGLMSVMRGGRVFEKVGVNVSAVEGNLAPAAQKAMAARGVPGMADDPRFWAAGISLVAHMVNPHAPAVHMNTRMFWTPHAWWFGGGSDLNPAIEYAGDTAHFHAQMQAACDAHDPAYYPKFKAWADTYFFVPHRGRARGVGGIFYDHLECADDAGFEANFAFTRDVGDAFLNIYPALVRRRMGMDFTREDKLKQLTWRGRYAEFNLVYDRGTLFGLKTGGNIDAILMSLPPEVTW